MNPLRTIALLGLVTVGAGSAGAEVIGDFQIIAVPVNAVVTHGGEAGIVWLNVENHPITVQEAFTGFSAIADGISNLPAGRQIELTFAPGVLRNDAGPDLVLLDADLDLNVYFVTTSYGDFSPLRVVTEFVDTGVDRVYYSSEGGDPQSHDVYAAAIDLTSFNVPPGQIVDRVRIFTEGPSCDPLALGVLLSACPADIDGSGHIDLSDLALLLGAFGSAHGDANWHARADLSADGAIGLEDLAELLARFGGAC